MLVAEKFSLFICDPETSRMKVYTYYADAEVRGDAPYIEDPPLPVDKTTPAGAAILVSCSIHTIVFSLEAN